MIKKLLQVAFAIFVILLVITMNNYLPSYEDTYITISKDDIEELYNDIHCHQQYLLQQISTDSILHDSGSIEDRIRISVDIIRPSIHKLDSIYLSY